MTEAAEEFHFSPRPNRASEIAWHHWSKEAFDEARSTGRPILLSISAVWCHWCHVMDETTYSHPSVIEIINRDYVPVRVDNDVRPDINQRYNMGGWPTTAFLTASGDILTGATYLPPDQMASALVRVAGYYRANQAEIASRVLEARKQAASGVARSAGELDSRLVDEILEAVKNAYDPDYGGFGGAPKFPQADAIVLLLEQSALRADDDLRRMAVHTLEKMTGGGTYDHVEGGFFRYSTTQDWSVPHFEKMLEDHAGLVHALSLAGMTEELDRTAGYLDKVLRDPSSGLYAGSQDADEHYYSMDAEERSSATAPYVDRRVYTSWNAALAVAFLDAGKDAQKTLDSLFKHAYRQGEGMSHAAGAGGQLADQAWSMLAAVRAHQRGLGAGWLEVARDLAGRPRVALSRTRPPRARVGRRVAPLVWADGRGLRPRPGQARTHDQGDDEKPRACPGRARGAPLCRHRSERRRPRRRLCRDHMLGAGVDTGCREGRNPRSHPSSRPRARVAFTFD